MGAKIYDLKILRVPGIAFDRSLSKFHGCQTQEFKFPRVPGTHGTRSNKAPGAKKLFETRFPACI